jgi:hypothetical protein
MSELTHVVRYVRNADPNEGTAAVTLREPDRPNLELGGEPGALTDDEFNLLGTRGLILEEVDEGDERNAALQRVEDHIAQQSGDDGLDGSTKPELEKIAKAEGVDLSDASNNEERVQLIREARAGVGGEGDESLPATATTGPTPPNAGAGGGAAGPEGAGGAGSAGGGAATAGEGGGTGGRP